MTLEQLREKRTKVVRRAREILETAEREERTLTGEERTNYDAAMDDATDLGETIARRERQEETERRLGEPQHPERRSGRTDVDAGGGPLDPEQRADDPYADGVREIDGVEYRNGDAQRPFASYAYAMAFRSFVRGGMSSVQDGPERRALQADLSTSGGFITTPEQFVNQLIQAVDDRVFVRELCRGRGSIESIPMAQSLGIPTLDTDPSDPDWTAEIKTGTEDSDMKFGKRELHPQPLGKRIKVSNKLLRLTPAAENLVNERLAYKFGVAQENGFLNGSGANQPLGLFTASADGISTARDVLTGSATDFTADGLKNGKYTLKGAYWANAEWILHREGVKRVAKLKDSDGQYIWSDGSRTIRGGEPDMLLGFPVNMSEFAPSTFTTGKYVAMLGDFAFYKIADALGMTVQRLVELYAESNQTGFIGRLETDGMPTLEEAWVRMKTS